MKRSLSPVLAFATSVCAYVALLVLLDDREPFLGPSLSSVNAKKIGTFRFSVRIEPTILDWYDAKLEIKEGWVEKKAATYTNRRCLLCFRIGSPSTPANAEPPSFWLASEKAYFASLNQEVFYANLVSIDHTQYTAYLISPGKKKTPVLLTIENQ